MSPSRSVLEIVCFVFCLFFPPPELRALLSSLSVVSLRRSNSRSRRLPLSLAGLEDGFEMLQDASRTCCPDVTPWLYMREREREGGGERKSYTEKENSFLPLAHSMESNVLSAYPLDISVARSSCKMSKH